METDCQYTIEPGQRNGDSPPVPMRGGVEIGRTRRAFKRARSQGARCGPHPLGPGPFAWLVRDGFREETNRRPDTCGVALPLFFLRYDSPSSRLWGGAGDKPVSDRFAGHRVGDRLAPVLRGKPEGEEVHLCSARRLRVGSERRADIRPSSPVVRRCCGNPLSRASCRTPSAIQRSRGALPDRSDPMRLPGGGSAAKTSAAVAVHPTMAPWARTISSVACLNRGK
jgi:hypothetical protein